jgi:hypothetical protein
MFKQRFIITSLFVLAVVSIALSSEFTEDGTGIIYGSDHAFMVTAPTGWVIDNKSGVHQGLWAVFYLVGSSWKNSTVVMYINTASKKTNPTLESLISYDFEQSRKESPGSHIESGDPLTLQDGTNATVKIFSGDKWNNYESIAYIEAPTVWVMVVLSSRHVAAYKAALPAFNSLVKTYKFLTTNVNIKK